jgi:hypothetical protein
MRVMASARGGRERSPDPLIEKPSTITGPVSRVLSVNGSRAALVLRKRR